DAWRQVSAHESDARLAIVGGGKPARIDALRRRIAASGIAGTMRIELSFVPVDRLCSWYRAADILVYPYKEATTSGALMTGISYGKPIIATSVPAMSELLRHHDNAWLVEYGNVDALSEALLRLIRDGELRRRLAEGSRQSLSTVPRWPEIARQT